MVGAGAPAASGEGGTKSDTPQTDKFLIWVEQEKAKGLKDVKFFSRNVADSTVEDFCTEVNEMLNAPDVPEQAPL